jgi:hypothetical protein
MRPVERLQAEGAAIPDRMLPAAAQLPERCQHHTLTRVGAGAAHGKKTRRRASASRPGAGRAERCVHAKPARTCSRSGGKKRPSHRLDGQGKGVRRAVGSSRPGYAFLLWLYPPQAGHCQVPACHCQSSWWLAAAQTEGLAGAGSSMLVGAGGSTDAWAPSGASMQALSSAAGMLSAML